MRAALNVPRESPPFTARYLPYAVCITSINQQSYFCIKPGSPASHAQGVT
jgi:hypothetical protein